MERGGQTPNWGGKVGKRRFIPSYTLEVNFYHGATANRRVAQLACVSAEDLLGR